MDGRMERREGGGRREREEEEGRERRKGERDRQGWGGGEVRSAKISSLMVMPFSQWVEEMQDYCCIKLNFKT